MGPGGSPLGAVPPMFESASDAPRASINSSPKQGWAVCPWSLIFDHRIPGRVPAVVLNLGDLEVKSASLFVRVFT